MNEFLWLTLGIFLGFCLCMWISSEIEAADWQVDEDDWLPEEEKRDEMRSDHDPR